MTTLDTPKTLHIRCGLDIQRNLQEAGFIGDFLEFSDPFCQGPVLDLPGLEWLSARSQFISQHYDMPLADVEQRQQLAYKRLSTAHQYEQVVLWFEHDNYDQLILAYVLTRLAAANLAERLQLICISDFPGIAHFTGLGQLSPEQLVYLYKQQRLEVSPAQYQDAKHTWHAFQQGEVAELNAIIKQGTPAIEPMAKALKRQLQELPWTDCGAGLTLQLVLQVLQDKGARTAGQLFHELNLVLEPLPHLGDLMFWALLKHQASEGLIQIQPSGSDWSQHLVSLPSMSQLQITNSWWVGPFDISRQDCPRWDPVSGQVVATG